MSEISLRYSANTNPKYVAPFKYVFASIIEYSFAYRRYITLADTSIFNGPVAVTKVATGLSELYDLFVDKQAHPIIYNNIGLFVDKNEHDIYQLNDRFINKDGRKLNEKVEKDKTFIPWAHHDVWSKTRYDDKDIFLKRFNTLKELDKYYSVKMINDSSLKLFKNEWVNHELFMSNFNDLFSSRPDNILNKLDITSLKRPTLLLNELNIYFGTPFTNNLNIYETIFGTPDEFKSVNWIVQLMSNRQVYTSELNDTIGVTPEIKYSDLNNILATKTPYKKSYIEYNIFGKTNNKYSDLNSIMISSGQQDKYSDLNKSTELSKGDITSQLHKDDFVKPPNKNGYIFKILSGRNFGKAAEYSYYDLLGKPISKKGTVYGILSGISILDNLAINKFLSGKPISKNGNMFETNLHIYKFGKEMSLSNNILSGNIINDKLFVENIYSLYKYKQELSVLDLDTFMIINNDQAIVMDDIFLASSNKQAFTIDKNIWLFKEDKLLNIIVNDIFVDNQEKNMFFQKENIFLFKDSKDMYENNTLINLTKNDMPLFMKDYTVFLNKQQKDLVLDSYGIFINNSNKDISNYWLSDDIIITRDRKSFEIQDLSMFVFKDNKSFEIQDLSVFTFKDRKSMELYQSIISINKQKNNLIIDDTIQTLFKNYLNTDLLQWDIITSWKNGHLSFVLDDVNVNLNKKDTSIFQSSTMLIKSLLQSNIVNNIDEVFKNYLPVDLIKPLFDSYNALIPLSKVKNQVYIQDINNMLYKSAQNSFIHEDEFISVMPRNIAIPDESLICDRSEHKVFIDYKNIFIAKAKMKVIIDSGLSIYKDASLGFVFDQEWLKKDIINIWLDKPINVSKNGKYGFVNEDTQIYLDSKLINIENSIFIDKTDKICYYDYDIWANKEIIRTGLNQQIELIQNTKREVIDFTEATLTKIKDSAVFYEDTVITTKTIYHSQLFNQINELYKTLQYAHIDINNFDNWVWVYEYPDPLEKAFGIDELLIPEQDTRYENFEDIIFDKETMRPRSPVKVINDTTFIAKYPIKHPINKYSDIAIDYDASAIKNAQYYGVETSIMYEVFLKYYQIWQTKIYEFSTMTINQSVTAMLNYLYSWIMVYFPPEDVEQALRVFKLIRWYGETAVIQNSQYVISYEYGTLESKLNTGTCAIPNNLDPISNPTMYVDSTLGVIRNNPNLVGLDKATVTFEIDNKKNSTISFSLSNTVGSVNIYINDVLVDTVSKSGLNYTYQLPYMGETNYVTIEKEASHNLNPYFYIGNIKIPNATFKNLSIEYDATLKAGNKPLNQMAKKMISVANLYDNPEEMYAIIKEGNIGVTETYKKMEEYWKLHHENKTKGKRLTIKQV